MIKKRNSSVDTEGHFLNNGNIIKIFPLTSPTVGRLRVSCIWTYSVQITVSVIIGAGQVGFPCAKERNWTRMFHHIPKSRMLVRCSHNSWTRNLLKENFKSFLILVWQWFLEGVSQNTSGYISKTIIVSNNNNNKIMINRIVVN